MKQRVVILLLVISSTLFGLGTSLDKYITDTFIDSKGNEIIEIVVPGGRPPEGYIRGNGVNVDSLKNLRSVVIIDDVPAFDWSYGCSATAGAMMAAFYDRNGFANIYTGPTNNGVMPLDNSSWNESSGGEGGDGECPLSATHLGLDGRTTRGHVDDYWIEYGNDDDDPYITDNLAQHEIADCTGDYMGTNQSYWSNSDGSTAFYYNNSGGAVHDFTGAETNTPPRKDGCHGLRQFFESRGYDVSTNYSQKIMGWDGNTSGFTFAQFKNEIDNGRPLFVHVTGHTMLGIGYDSTTEEIYINNTWDYSTHTMSWAGVYSGMNHYGVTVINLAPNINNGDIAITFNLSDNYGDGWNSGGDYNYIAFQGIEITISSGSSSTFTYYMAPGEYDYTYYENDGWGGENSWNITLEDGTILSSGAGTTSGGNSSANASYSLTIPGGELPVVTNINIEKTGDSTLTVSWDSAGSYSYKIYNSSEADFIADENSYITKISGTSYNYNGQAAKRFFKVVVTDE